MRAILFLSLALCSCVTQTDTKPTCGARPLEPGFAVEFLSEPNKACMGDDEWYALEEYHIAMFHWANCITGEVAKP